MALLESEIDANFYNLIHQLPGSLQKEETADRRDGRRQVFQAIHRIALRRGPDMPDESEFFEVRCRDLAGGGFSFFLRNKPNFDSLVAAFGIPPNVIYLDAKISHCDDVLVHPSGLIERVDVQTEHVDRQNTDIQVATPMVLVGCRFVRRLAGENGSSE